MRRKFGGRRAGFTDDDILRILNELTGMEWGTWWMGHIRRPDEVDLDALLAPVGLMLSYEPPKGESPTRAWAGWTADTKDGVTRLTMVEKGSPAWDSGFGPDDIIVALDGHWVTADRVGDALAEKKPGDRVRVSFFRHDQLMDKTLTLGSTPRGKPTVKPVAKPTAAQKALFKRWLLIDFPKS